jgi:hypothetical protein
MGALWLCQLQDYIGIQEPHHTSPAASSASETASVVVAPEDTLRRRRRHLTFGTELAEGGHLIVWPPTHGPPYSIRVLDEDGEAEESTPARGGHTVRNSVGEAGERAG